MQGLDLPARAVFLRWRNEWKNVALLNETYFAAGGGGNRAAPPISANGGDSARRDWRSPVPTARGTVSEALILAIHKSIFLKSIQ